MLPLAAATGLICALAAPAAAAGEAASAADPLDHAGVVVDAPGADPLPAVKARSWLLADLDTGEVLAAKNAHGRLRPASTLKVLTALTLLPELDPAAPYVARWEDANVDGSKVGIVPDATYSVHNLFEAMFLVSGNDAARALAHAAGGVRPTVDRMNEVARELGALDTTAVNVSGLDARGQLSSAYDLAVISRAAMAREDFRAYAATVKSRFPGKMPRHDKARKTYEIYTQDRLLLNYRGAIGIKTGWTTKARGTFVGAATRGGRTLVATVMHTDHDAWRLSGDLLTWGFRNAEHANPVGSLDAAGPETAAGPARLTGPGRVAAPTTVAAGGSDGGLPWFVQVPLVLSVVVAVLRARVLLKQRRRPGRPLEAWARVAGQPQSRDRRLVTTEAAAAPNPAVTSAPRQRLGLEAEAGSTSSASTGTAS